MQPHYRSSVEQDIFLHVQTEKGFKKARAAKFSSAPANTGNRGGHSDRSVIRDYRKVSKILNANFHSHYENGYHYINVLRIEKEDYAYAKENGEDTTDYEYTDYAWIETDGDFYNVGIGEDTVFTHEDIKVVCLWMEHNFNSRLKLGKLCTK